MIVRNKFYKVMLLQERLPVPYITLWRASDYFIYDWSTNSFIQDQAKKPTFPLFLHINYTPPGPIQLWTLKFDTSKFADGLYFLTYCSEDGTIFQAGSQEYFYVIGGSPDLPFT